METGIALALVAITLAALGARWRRVSHAALAPGARVGSWSLVRPLARGGMGEVWLAEHRGLDRPAALKVVRPDRLASAEADAQRRLLRRFEREARATASLRSPHTVEVYDFGRTTAGQFYYAMEYLDGRTLDELVRADGPQEPRRVARLLLQVCASLGEAHRNDLVHRDIKPANIMAARIGLDDDFVKVLDFGLVTQPTGAGETRLTHEGHAQGTPAFMPPEVATGESAPDGRSDIYALGCVGYWLLTGKMVFEAESPIAAAVAHVTAAPTPLRCDDCCPINAVIMRCLAKKPADRYQSVEALARDLAPIADRACATSLLR